MLIGGPQRGLAISRGSFCFRKLFLNIELKLSPLKLNFFSLPESVLWIQDAKSLIGV
jgi:hypothetical protein